MITTSLTSDSSSVQTHRTWIKKIQVPLGCTILQVFVSNNENISLNQPLFEYKVFNPQTQSDRVGVFLSSIYKNLQTNTMCKARVVNVMIPSSSSNNNDNSSNLNLPFVVQSESDRTILLMEYVDESVKESSTLDSFEPKSPVYTLL
ncbi:hypothetical protein FDP41_007435 [Naegleria fowleri]|uniref:Uncharacterized protein n=1 Tax=Naegleria fowleri TaxID=5763 RepID=A0A6A5CFY0_NAEFO|nr:uncharacterized protein FDP41_007435 [Naegleria fowleri]KAF0984258.1 hypothetical protein FDP41_007435 [Naegleria fowleri]CAG4709507.1 unnamed protein product [Naegleria fowleri]